MHSKHGVTPGSSTRACPLNPSVPPSTIGLMVEISGLPSSLYPSSKRKKSHSVCGCSQVCCSKSTIKQNNREAITYEGRNTPLHSYTDVLQENPIQELSRGTARRMQYPFPVSCSCVGQLSHCSLAPSLSLRQQLPWTFRHQIT